MGTDEVKVHQTVQGVIFCSPLKAAHNSSVILCVQSQWVRITLLYTH